MSGDFDLLKANEDLVDAGTAAFYGPDTQRVAVRGTDMTVEVRVTLAHELTHVLQESALRRRDGAHCRVRDVRGAGSVPSPRRRRRQPDRTRICHEPAR